MIFRRSGWLRSGFCGIVLAVLPFMGASESLARSDTASEARPFHLRLPGDPETLDWTYVTTATEVGMVMNLMEGLVALGSDLKVRPALAEKWKISEDGRTYTFTLKRGLKWSDGLPLRAQDFVYSWKRLLSPTQAAPYAYLLFDIEAAELYNKGKLQDFGEVGIKALDDSTLQVRLARAVEPWLYVPTFCATFPLRQDLIEAHGNAWASPGRMAVTGPFILASRDSGVRMVLRRNPHYHGERGEIGEVVARVVGDDNTAVELFKKQELAYVGDVPGAAKRQFKSRSELKPYLALNTVYLGFAVTKHPLQDAQARKAIATALDKVQLAQVLAGGEWPAGSLVPPPLLAASMKVGLPHDPTKARVLWKGAGLDSSMKLTLAYARDARQTAIAELIQKQLKRALGIDITLVPLSGKAFRIQQNLRNHHLFLSNWYADYPDPDNFLSVFLMLSGNNKTGWKSERFDELVKSARYVSREAREKKYLEAQKLLLEEEAAIAPLYYESKASLVSGKARRVDIHPMNYVLLRNVSWAAR